MKIQLGSVCTLAGTLALTVGLVACGSAQRQRYSQLEKQFFRAAERDRSFRQEKPGGKIDRDILDLGTFIKAVLAQNPSLDAARQAWRAAIEKYPQVNAVEDPTVEYAFAPLSIGSDAVRFGQVLSISQRLPWPGKISLAGDACLLYTSPSPRDQRGSRMPSSA